MKHLLCTKSLIAITLILLSACSKTHGRLDSAEIGDEFIKSADLAVAKYRPLFRESSTLTLEDRVTIAGELIKHDPDHYGEYYALISKSAHSSNEVVAATAANSLRNAKGMESINLLFSMLSSKPIVARAASHSINYRFVTSKNDHRSTGDFFVIKQRLDQACGSEALAEYVRSVICVH